MLLSEYQSWINYKATVRLLAKLEEGEKSGREQGWLTADEVEAMLGL